MCRNYRTRKFFHDKSKILLLPSNVQKFLGGLNSKESTCDAGDLGLIPGSGKSFGEGNGNPLQYSCLENSMDRGAWWATSWDSGFFPPGCVIRSKLLAVSGLSRQCVV